MELGGVEFINEGFLVFMGDLYMGGPLGVGVGPDELISQSPNDVTTLTRGSPRSGGTWAPGRTLLASVKAHSPSTHAAFYRLAKLGEYLPRWVSPPSVWDRAGN
jgi:hypothetical protein